MIATATPYEIAVEFIKLGDIYRAASWAGLDTTAITWEMVELRDRLDRMLGRALPIVTDAEWDLLVRMRLTRKANVAA